MSRILKASVLGGVAAGVLLLASGCEKKAEPVRPATPANPAATPPAGGATTSPTTSGS